MPIELFTSLKYQRKIFGKIWIHIFEPQPPSVGGTKNEKEPKLLDMNYHTHRNKTRSKR